MVVGEAVLRESVDLDNALQGWMDRLPAQWAFVVREAADIRVTFYGQYHVYQDHWASRVLNHYHLGRLLVNEVILAYISKLEEPAREWVRQKERSLRIVNEMATNVCIGMTAQGLFNDRGMSPDACAPRPLMKGVFMMIDPLTIAASATGVSDRLRSWVIQTLQTMGDCMGIRHALESIRRIQLAVANEVPLGALFQRADSWG
jgi:hypothetical protein